VYAELLSPGAQPWPLLTRRGQHGEPCALHQLLTNAVTGRFWRSSFPHRGLCRSSAKGRQPPQAASARTRFAIQARVENSSHPLADTNRSYLDRFPLKTEPGVLSLERRSLSEQPLPMDARLRLPGCVPSLRTSSRASRAGALIFTLCLRRRPGPSSRAATRSRSRFLRDHSEKRPEGCRPTVVPYRGTVGIWRKCDKLRGLDSSPGPLPHQYAP
jgi:hypothetical protein